MTEIKFESPDNEPDAFNLYNEGKKIGEMIVEIKGTDMTVFHTEVDEDQEGKGYGGMLLASMVSYVREHHLKVIPMCSYVHAQFDRHPDKYKDIRSKNEIRF
ncbi:MAG TPA: GNAT family N-acetyltransferase [Pedobacter sp.]